jgi:hypothetical protein
MPAGGHPPRWTALKRGATLLIEPKVQRPLAALKLEIGSRIGARFRVTEVFAEQGGVRWYRVEDETSGARFDAVPVNRAEADALSPIRGVIHAHLAQIVELIPGEGDASFLIAEHVPGHDLDGYIREHLGKHESQVDAVRLMLRIADALSSVHAIGAAHGRVRPAAIVADAEARASPVVCFAGAHKPAGVYRSPERGPVDPPSAADDAWAVSALFYHALTGNEPPARGLGSLEQLQAAGIADQRLAEALLHGLAMDVHARSADLKPLRRELARWFVDHVSEESVDPAPHTTEPPPLPQARAGKAQAPLAVASTMPPPSKARRKIPLMVGLGIVLGLGVAWAVSTILVGRQPDAEVARPPSVAKKQNKEIALTEVAVTGERASLTGDKTATCVAGYLPKGALGKPPDLSWLCSETDPREGALKLHIAVIEGAPNGQRPTKAMKLFSTMSWYQMAALAVVRAGCCQDAPPLSLPQPNPSCQPMDAILRDIGRLVVAGENFDERMKAFRQTVYCEAKHGRAGFYRRPDTLKGGEDSSFLEMVKELEPP